MILNNCGRVLYGDGNVLYAQIGKFPGKSADAGMTWQNVPVSLLTDALSLFPLYDRLLRRGIHAVLPVEDSLLCIVNNRVCCFSKEGVLESAFMVPRGTRPLFIARNKNNALFWGEYFQNTAREAVNVYVSQDKGKSWDIIYAFEQYQIRHVHGVFYDPFDDNLWITTGDTNEESGIWMTDDEFKTIKKVTCGSQHSRALQLLITKDYIYYGTDTPYAKNYLCRLHKQSGRIDKLCEVDSSVYWGCSVGGWFFFSTVVEPSRVNKTPYAQIIASPDGNDWRVIKQFKKDWLPAKYFQIGQILFPQGHTAGEHLFFTPIATEDHYTLQRMSIKEIKDLYDQKDRLLV